MVTIDFETRSQHYIVPDNVRVEPAGRPLCGVGPFFLAWWPAAGEQGEQVAIYRMQTVESVFEDIDTHRGRSVRFAVWYARREARIEAKAAFYGCRRDSYVFMRRNCGLEDAVGSSEGPQLPEVYHVEV